MAAPSIIQSKATRLTSASTSLTATFDTTPAVGRLICVFGYATGGLPTIADNQGNTYTQRASEGYAAVWGRLWTAPANTSSGSFTLTLTPSSGSQILSLVVFEIANWNTSPVFEFASFAWASISSSDSPYSPLNFGASSNPEQLYLAALGWNSGIVHTYVAASGWTDQLLYTGTASMGVSVISKTVTSTGTYDPTFTLDAGSTDSLVLGISLVGGTQGASSSFIPRRMMLGVG